MNFLKKFLRIGSGSSLKIHESKHGGDYRIESCKYCEDEC